MTVQCEVCGLTYQNFRTGFLYRDIYAMLWVGSDDPTKWKHKRRNTILGRWHQIKLEMWEEHLELCSKIAQFSAVKKSEIEALGVPF